ncbi:hypothetical protein FRC09_010976 [Ceratobasidium sp. 395]|nr:hypothetical protein FRC09_010976 [Ceratobasidium sp. 395]
MFKLRSKLFLHINDNPNPQENDWLLKHRTRQRRPFSSNPFKSVESTTLGGVEAANLPSLSHRPTELGDDQQFKNQENTSTGSAHEEPHGSLKSHDAEWQKPSEWLDLLYDLAWTASFSSLTSTNKFKTPWDSVSYIAFFTIMWWIWTSQVFYSIDFYMDDWLHLIFIFFQIIIFGLLATFARGLDVSSYILHSPGSTDWEKYDYENVKPELYAAERLTKKSFELVAIVIAVSRTLLFLQYIIGDSHIINMYAKRTNGAARFPLRLLIVPCSLIVSIGLFFAGYAVTAKHGEEPTGAKIKFVLWGSALLVEMVAHIFRLQLEIKGDLRPKPQGSIVGRFGSITTIIMGEGINAIAGIFYSVERAPVFNKSMIAGILSCAIIVFFLVYLYYEGAAPLEKKVRRRAAWAMVHLPWLLSVILLLEGVKSQLLLSDFNYSYNYVLEQNSNALSANFTEPEFEKVFGDILLKAGMTLRDQVDYYEDMQYQNATAANITIAELDDNTLDEIYGVWFARLQFSSVLNIYLTFMENDTIADDTQDLIQRYKNDYNFTYQDSTSDYLYIAYDIVLELVKPSENNARYVMALSGLTLISLATLNLIQSWPRDRFQWISIITRYAIGASMTLLLVLNVVPDREDPALYRWIYSYVDSAVRVAGVLTTGSSTIRNWALPTIAIAYILQFLIDTALVYIAKRYGDTDRSVSERVNKSD